MPNEFLSPDGDLENYFVTEYWLIDQYIGDQLWTWGNGSNGRLGNAVTSGNISTLVTTFSGGTNWKQVSAGIFNTAAIKTDGTLWTWGPALGYVLGINQQLGDRSTPVTTFAGGTDWKQVSVGSLHMAAIKIDGTLWSWGNGSGGKIGNNAPYGVLTRTPLTTFAGGTNWKQVSAGNNHTAAIKTDGTLWTWGNGTYNSGSQLWENVVATPITTFAGGTNWKQVSSGYNHTTAIKTDGTLWTWGNQSYGKLGDGTFLDASTSTPVTTFAGGNNWKQVSCGRSHTAAIKTDGTLWTWGGGNFGQLGNTQTTNRSTPVTTFAGGTDWKQVSSGGNHTAAIKTDGTLWVWGNGTFGKLGTAQTTNASTPVTTFVGGTNWKQVSAGNNHTTAVQAGINAEYPLS